ncbi:MAG TPA: PAS domain-containing protein, partial [Flavisolibacter sp.]|nr:PAS domain-containing protein [Flavisolibacter sp.]
GAEVTGILHVIHDVTKEVDLRKSLNERLQLIESIVQSSVDRIIALDRNMNYIYWNRKAEEYYRLTKEEVLGKNILDVFPQMVNDPSYVEIRRALKGETIHLAADPRNEKYFETYLVPIKGERGEVTTLLWVAHDLTKEWQLEQERRRVQAQVEEEHRRLKEAQAIGRLGSFEWTVGEPVTHWSDELYYINGLEPRSEVITLEKVDQFIHPDDFEEVQALKEKSFLQAGDYSLVHRIVRRDGEVRWVNHMWESIADATGKIIKVVGVVQDITERHKAQYAEEQLKDFNLLLKQQVEERTLALQESKQLIEEITLTTPDLITIHDVTTNTIIYSNHENYWNDFFDTGVIYTLNDEQQAAAMIHPDDLKKGTDFMEERRLLQDNEMKEVELKMKPGRYVRIRSKIFKRDEKGQATQIISFTTDITKHKKAEEEVQKNLTILKQAEDIAAIGSWEYQIPSGRFSWSDGMYRIFDYPMGAPVNPDIYVNQAVEEDRGIAKRIVKNLRKTHQPMEETVRIHREDGARTVKVKATPVTDEHGVVQKMIGVDMDVTDINEAEKKLKESQHWLEETSKASPDAIIIYDLHKKQPVFLNNCLSEWTGKSLDELVSMGIEGRLQLIHRDDRPNLLHFNEKIAMAKDGDVLTLEYRIFSKEEQARWIRNRSKVFQRDAAGKVTHILSILQDVSEEKAAERLLKSLNTSLERQNRELEAKSDEITSFAFVASHDLKEPICKILTFSDWLLSRETNLSEGGKQSLTRLSNAVKRLDILVEDIVALTKVHVEKEDLHDVCLNVVLRRAKQEMQETLERSGAQIIAEQLPTVKGVENHLVYLFKNLLGNSIKFQQPGNQPVIHISAVSIDGFVKLIFTDNGIGFAPEYSKKVFQMFRRLHGKHEYEGTGMGLAICKRIMEKHGGNITAEGEKDNGATFTCWFPAS